MKTSNLQNFKARVCSAFSESTFEECSLDTSNSCSLINNSDLGVYNFDSITEVLVKQHLDNPKCKIPDSLDSLYLEEESIIFVEFKNIFWHKINSDEIRMKIYESIALICKIYDLNRDDIKDTKIYIIHKSNADKPETHMFTNGLCPNNFFFLEETLGVEILRYDATNFEEYLREYRVLPSRD